LVQRHVAAVGIDGPSIDAGVAHDFPAHRNLLGAHIPLLENLTLLHTLPVRGAFVIALPMKIAFGTGAPTRVVAILP
jgi:kynurenine formamidase